MSPPSCWPFRPITTLVLTINVLIFMIQVIQSSDWTNSMSNQPIQTVYWHQAYRFLTHSFQHLSFSHILFNMLFLVFIGNPIEADFGSLPTLGLTLLFPLIQGLLYTYIHYFLSVITGNPHWLQIAVAGYSDTLFALVWLYCVGFGLTSISLFGILSIPARLYPFLLLVISGLGSSVSFVAHGTGLIAGLSYHYGILNYCTVPRVWLLWWETQTAPGRFIRRVLPNYVDTPSQPNAHIQLEQFGWTGKRYPQQPAPPQLPTCGQCFPTLCASSSSQILGAPTQRSIELREAARQRAGAQFVRTQNNNNNNNTIPNNNNNNNNNGIIILPTRNGYHQQQDHGDDDDDDPDAARQFAATAAIIGQPLHNNNNNNTLEESDNDDHDPEMGLLNQPLDSSMIVPPGSYYQSQITIVNNQPKLKNHSNDHISGT